MPTATLTVDWVSRTWHGAPAGPREAGSRDKWGRGMGRGRGRGRDWSWSQMLSASHDEYETASPGNIKIELL